MTILAELVPPFLRDRYRELSETECRLNGRPLASGVHFPQCPKCWRRLWPAEGQLGCAACRRPSDFINSVRAGEAAGRMTGRETSDGRSE